MKKKFALAALLMAALMLVPSFAMAKEQTQTKRYRLPVNVSVNDSEGGKDYTIWLTCEIHDMCEDGDLSQFLTVKSATQDDESLDIYLETETMNWWVLDGYDKNAHPITFTKVDDGHFKGYWKSVFSGFGSVSVAGDHTCVYRDADTETQDATCETAASTVKTCAYCGHKDVKTSGTALGHEFGEYIYDDNATCLADGTKTRTCSRCNKTETIDAEGTALGHDFGDYVFDNNATCTTDGTETAKCSRCDETDVRTAEGTAMGHQSDDGTVTREATLLEAGEIEYRCTRCNELLRTEAIPKLESGVPKTNDGARMLLIALITLGATGSAGAAIYRKRSDVK